MDVGLPTTNSWPDPPMIATSTRAGTPGDWRQQWREALSDPRELLEILGLHGLKGQLGAAAQAQFPLRVPRAFVARMRRGDPNDPLLRQVLPLSAEELPVPGYTLDAVGDLASRAGAGILHKYTGRALLITTGSCAVHCRYCFRRHFPYSEETAARAHWQPTIAELSEQPGIEELLLSGGDPLSLTTAKLAELSSQLQGLGQLKRLRIHTRLPIVLPDRVDAEFCAWLSGLPWPVAIVLHSNHAQELDAEVAAACERLRAAGASLLNQSVLLAGVNDQVSALSELSQRLFAIGVLPYYLHLLDKVHGAAHFEVADDRVAELESALRSQLPGYLMPRFVREQAGAPYKLPFAPAACISGPARG